MFKSLTAFHMHICKPSGLEVTSVSFIFSLLLYRIIALLPSRVPTVLCLALLAYQFHLKLRPQETPLTAYSPSFPVSICPHNTSSIAKKGVYQSLSSYVSKILSMGKCQLSKIKAGKDKETWHLTAHLIRLIGKCSIQPFHPTITIHSIIHLN